MSMLSVVIPAYNEEGGIEDIARRVIAVRPELEEMDICLEVLIVDDCSRDKTFAIAQEIADQTDCLKVIHHPVNRGYGGALKTGFCEASGDMIGFLDADGTYPPEYFPQLCHKILEGADLVIGSRMSGAESKMPATRRIGNLFFARLLSLLGRQKVTDSASGMRVFWRGILKQLYPLPNGLNLTPVMSARAVHEDIKVVEVPIPYEERVGRSKLSVIRDGMVFLRSIVWTVLYYNPVRILGMIGVAGVGFAGLVGLGLVAARISGITQIGPWGVAALYAALLAGVCGVSIYALGATSNILVALFFDNPIRQGLFGKPVFKQPLEHQFGWMGLTAILLGLIVAITSMVVGIRSGDVGKIWLYLLGSAMIILTGFQLSIFWGLARILEELHQREILTSHDLQVTVFDKELVR